MSQKSWKWIEAYEKARKNNSPEQSKIIANKTIKRRPRKKDDCGLFGNFW